MQTRGSATINGLDFSSFQSITNETTLFTNSPNFNYLRAYGSSGTADSTFVTRVALCKTHGVPSGAYYFAQPTKPITSGGDVQCDAQCDNFITILQQAYGTGQFGDLVPMLDVESWGSTTPQHPMYDGLTGDQLIDWVKRFRDRFFNTTNRRLGFYSDRYFLKDPTQMNISDGKLAEINNMPLWLAEYDIYYPNNTNPANSPANLGGWTTYCLWQYGAIADASSFGLYHAQNQVDHDITDSIDRIKPPPAPTNIVATQTDNNTLQISFTRPNIVDYLGTSLYVNGTWKKWLAKAAQSDVFTLDVTNYARNVETLYQLVAEDDYSDFGYSAEQSITLYYPSSPPPDPPPTDNGVITLPTVSMGTKLKKGVTVIASLTSIDGLNLKSETTESTVLDTVGGYRTYVSTLKDAGEVAISGYFDYTAHGTLLADFEALTVQSYTIEFPDKGTTTGTTWTFSAVITDYHTSVDLSALIKFSATLKVSGKPTLAGPV